LGDDIVVFSSDDRKNVVGQFRGLRQQAQKESAEPYYCLSDFVASQESEVPDYVGAFACSAGFGLEDLCKHYAADNDDYHSILAKAIADRLAEALAEHLHQKVRQSVWGFAAHENLSPQECLDVKYQGIRPAPGYPTQPDHTEKQTLWKLMQVEEKTGIQLTESLAMHPAASVSGLYFASPKASYFSLGKVCEDQTKDYASRKGSAMDEVERWLGSSLSYK